MQFVLYDLPPHAADALTNAVASNAAYLQLAPPTQAQAVAQVAALTRQMNKLLRALVGELQNINDG